MNFFGGSEPAKPAGPDPLFAAQTEMEMYTDLFNKLTASCWTKCSSRKHKEPDLSLGEMSCAGKQK